MINTDCEDVFKCCKCGELIRLRKSIILIKTLTCGECKENNFRKLLPEEIFDEQISLSDHELLRKMRILC